MQCALYIDLFYFYPFLGFIISYVLIKHFCQIILILDIKERKYHERKSKFYLRERAFRWAKRIVIAIVVLFAINLPADICIPMIVAAVVGAQAITAEGKIKKVSYLAVSAIALTFAFPAFSIPFFLSHTCYYLQL